ncbi:2525_t:CDS:2, partial [Gigaspora margarita]
STRVSIYEDIHQVVDMIKSCNAIASQVWIYLLQIEKEDFSDGCSQLALILVNQCHSHEAYSSQRIERRVAEFSTSVPNNRFSSLVFYLSSNESACPGIPRQNRWKMRSRLERLNDETRNLV